MSHIYQPSESSFFEGIDKFNLLCKKIFMSINNQVEKLLIHPPFWRFVGFVSSAVGLLCFALSLSFQRLFGKWNVWKIFLYGALSFIITGFMLLPKNWRLSRKMWIKVHIVFLGFVLTSLGSFFYEKKTSGKPDRLGLSSISLFALSSFSLSRQINIGFEVGFTNFFLATFTVQIMQINPYLVFLPAAIYYAIVKVRSYLESRLEETVTISIQHVVIDIDSAAAVVEGTENNSLNPRLCDNLRYIYRDDWYPLASKADTNEESTSIEGITQIRHLSLKAETIANLVELSSLNPSSDAFFNQLRSLLWHLFLMHSLPSTFRAASLVELHIDISHITKLWGGIQNLINLKILKVTGCLHLMEFPGWSSKLEELDLSECTKLWPFLPSSLLHVNTHAELNVNSCEKLGSLQCESHLKSPKNPSFQGCSSLKKLSKVKTE